VRERSTPRRSAPRMSGPRVSPTCSIARPERIARGSSPARAFGRTAPARRDRRGAGPFPALIVADEPVSRSTSRCRRGC
jgi:hypothetical protein